ncbi:MAG: MFS transporter [Chromatiales bacterium]|nr:MFS transporter [Chromatiales bacterium]
MPTLLREQGVPVATIATLTSVIILPWAFKFLWAPLVDVMRGPRWGHRAWIVVAQLLMGLTLLPLAFLDWAATLPLLFLLLVVHAFAAATQDVAIDAWAISVTPPEERGSINGFMQLGMLVGRWLFGAGFLMVAHLVDHTLAVLAMVGTVWLTTLVVLFAGDVDDYAGAGSIRTRLRQFLTTLRVAFSRQSTWLGLLLALTAFAGFKAVGDIAGPFLVDRSFSEGSIGLFFTMALLAMIGGSLAGGWSADRFGKRRTVAALVPLTAAVVLLTSLLDVLEPGGSMVIAGLLAVYLCAGLLTASAYALFMQLTDPRLGATQFSAYMGAINAGEAWAGFTAGQLAGRLDYPLAFTVVALLSLAALLVTARLRSQA